jgi:predicted alpha/beta-fold hydrolase
LTRREEIYSSPWWLRGGHAQTIWGKLLRKRRDLPLIQRTFATSDADVLEVYSLPEIVAAPHLVLLHGLEGSLRSHYVTGILAEASHARFNAHVLMFRSCGSAANRTKRFYHSGDTEDARLVIESLAAEHPLSQFFLAGVSLGGNVLLKYLGEAPESVPANVIAAAAVSVPYDLSRSAATIDRGFSRVYQRFFLRTLKAKVAEKSRHFADLPSAELMKRVRTMAEFDDVVTAPIHGFDGAEDYYARSSAFRFLAGIRVPTLLLGAYDDPFLPAEVLAAVAKEAEKNSALHIEFHARGGHVGFVRGPFPWQVDYYMERRVLGFFHGYMTHSAEAKRPK